jgi:hypothetical protein
MKVQKKLPEGGKIEKYKPLELSLPTEDSIPETQMSRYSFFVYGKQGIGKTTFSLQFPRTLHMMFEPGAKSKAFRKIEPANWKEVVEYTRLIKNTDQYDTVVIDTTDLMWDMCVKQVCTEKGVEYLKDIGFGDGYDIAGTKFREVLIDLHSKKGLVILSHEKVRISEDKDETGYIIPSSKKRCTETIAKWADITGHYFIDKSGRRHMRIRANANAEAKCRPDEFFNYKDGTPIMDIPMGNNPKESYDTFQLAFNNQLDNPKGKPTQIKTFKI